jgi:hypothetical protein
MATNWGDAFLTAVRTVLVAIPSLPTTRAWMNTTVQPSVMAPFIADRVVAFDSVPSACGPGANKRRTVAYQVIISWPVGQDGFDTLTMSAAIEDAFQAATEAGTMTITGGDPIELVSVRGGPMQEPPERLLYPVTLVLQFDHP